MVRLLTRIADWLHQPDTIGRPTNIGRASYPLAVRGALDPDRVPDWFTRSPDWSAWDDAAVLQDAVTKCTVLFACLTYLADAISESPLEVYKTVNGERDVAQDRVADPVRDLLTAPNPYLSGSEFNLLMVLVMGIHGYSVVEKVRAGSGLPVQLWLLRPDWLSRRQSADSSRYWEYPKSPSGIRRIPDEDIVIVPYYPDPSMASRGLSPGQVAAREVGIDSGLTDFLKTFLDAGGIPPFVLTHPDPIYDDAVITAMQEKWRAKYGGKRAYGALPVLHGGYQIQEIGGSLDEMAWPDLRGLTEQKIAQAFRVPLELVQGQMAMQSGGLETTRFEGAMGVLQRYGAAPLRARIDGALTRGILAEFTGGDPAYELAFDTSGILALQEDTDQLHTRVRADVGMPLLTLNEGRRAIGEKEIDGGDVFAMPFSVTLVPMAELMPTVSTTTTAPPVLPAKSGQRIYRNTKALSPHALQTRASALDRTRKDRQKLTEIGTRALRRFWVEQGERIVATVTGKSERGIQYRVAEAVDWQDEERKLAEVLLRFYHANGEAAFKATADLFSVDIAWDLANPNVQRVAADLAKRIVGIAESTRADVRRIVSDSLTEGVTIQELRDRLTGLFTQTYRNRAEAVARTESMVAYSRASLVSYTESGEVDEVELHDNPSHTDSYGASDGLTCAERNGLVVAVSQADIHINAEHPNGSLAVSPILAKPLGEE